MILLQGVISDIFSLLEIFVFLTFIIPVITIIRTRKYIKSTPEKKITTTHFILISLKNLLFAITVVTIVGFSIFVLLDIL